MKLFSKTLAIVMAVGATPYAIAVEKGYDLPTTPLDTFKSQAECINLVRNTIVGSGLAGYAIRQDRDDYALWIIKRPNKSYIIRFICEDYARYGRYPEGRWDLKTIKELDLEEKKKKVEDMYALQNILLKLRPPLH